MLLPDKIALFAKIEPRKTVFFFLIGGGKFFVTVDVGEENRITFQQQINLRHTAVCKIKIELTGPQTFYKNNYHLWLKWPMNCLLLSTRLANQVDAEICCWVVLTRSVCQCSFFLWKVFKDAQTSLLKVCTKMGVFGRLTLNQLEKTRIGYWPEMKKQILRRRLLTSVS